VSRTDRRLDFIFRRHELPLFIGLILLWMALWREVSWMSLVSGIMVTYIATRVFYLPPVDLAGRFNVWFALRFLEYFLRHLSIASFQVAWLAFRPGPPPKSAIIAVQLRTQSDFILTATGLTISLIPGSLVAEVDRFTSTLYLHMLNMPTEDDVSKMREEVIRIETLLIRAIGSPAELEELR
jgi:multicomponent Na+:H+ antiporter subunit E